MSTTLVKPAEVERKWYLLDAAGKSLGHVAAEDRKSTRLNSSHRV